MKKIFLLLFMVMAGLSMKAQEASIIRYKSSFMINFIRYVGWPDDAKTGDFVIGVLKNSGVVDELRSQTNGKKFGYQNIVIKEFKNVEDIEKCQMLYVSNMVNLNKNMAAIAAKLKNKNTLIVTERDGAAQEGAMINFVVVDNKLKFEVSTENAEKVGLKLSNSLLAMTNAIKV